jgi:hypothetical protein
MTTSHNELEHPFRAGVFNSVERAQAAVSALLANGFTPAQISVLCDDDLKERHFRAFEHTEPAGTNTPASAAIGSAVGATVMGMGSAAAGSMFGLAAAAAMGGAGLWTGTIFGGFVGAMMSRGTENELANFYNQAVQQGKILVAAEVHGENAEPRLASAATILAELGAEPLPLPEG